MTNQNSVEEILRIQIGNLFLFILNTFVLPTSSKNLNIEIYEIIIVTVVLYGCETWSLTIREECRPKVFENRIIRWVFGLKRDANVEWRLLQNGELHSLYRSPNILWSG